MEYFTLTKQDILDNFDRGAYMRGFIYWRKQKVLQYDLYNEKRDTVLVKAIVEGSHIYRQEIVFSDFDNLCIESDCSCPVGFGCKHAVAVLFQLLEDEVFVLPKVKIKHLATQWLDKFIDVYKKEDITTTVEIDNFLIFRLFEESYEQINFYKAKILKNNNISKGMSLSKYSLFDSYHNTWNYNYFTDKDRKIIKSISNILGDNYELIFEGKYGAILLKELCETNKAFFKKNQMPLQFIEEKKILSFSWEEDKDQNKLLSNLKKNEFLIAQTIPPLCINTVDNKFYEVEIPYDSEVLGFMLNAPTIDKESMFDMVKKILNILPEIDFPIPKSFPLEKLKIRPKPHLRLYRQKIEKQTMHLMCLNFSYDGHMVKSHAKQSTIVVNVEDKYTKIIRDTIVEREYEKVIKDFTFEYDAKILAYLSPAKPTMQVGIERWRDFIENRIDSLREDGWMIEIDENFNLNFEYMKTITVESLDASKMNPWFELSFSVDIGGKNVTLMPIVVSLLEEFDNVESLPERLNLELEEGRFLHIESKEIKPILKIIFELFDKKEADSLIIRSYDAHLLDIGEDSDIIWKGVKELKELSQKLKDFKGIESVKPSPNLKTKLREYQQFGLDWLNFLYTFKFGGILADDMGLGKTVQTLAFLQILKEKGELDNPSLIIMPTSLMGNWKNEIQKFTSNLTFLKLYGIDRAEKFKQINNYDIILTTYSLAQRDKDKYLDKKFKYIILDEAQKIKNPKTKMAIAIKSFISEYKLALSGTPIENHLGELWSIFDFLMPGFLDNLKFFKTYYQVPIEIEHDFSTRALLNKKIAPFILRRTKDEVVKELPSKVLIVKKAIFGKKQATLYENIRMTMESKVRDAIRGKGLSRSHITILDALLKLRQVCCHPQLLKLQSAKNIKESAKLKMFLELISELEAEGRKVLVFSQFTSMLTIIENEIKKRKITYTKLTGATRKRDEVIDRFTKGEAQIFLISLKAGGIGLNLVEADTVIHYDPWWNPAVENQATDRAHRIGQDKVVFVYKLIVENSIEEQILKLQEKKRVLQEGIYKNNENKKEKFSGDELLSLLKL